MNPSRGTVRKRAKGFITETWQSQANLSLFLCLEVLIAFVLPTLGFGRDDFRLYSNLGFSIMLVSGVAIAWGRRNLFIMAVIVGAVAMCLRWLSWYEGTLRTAIWADFATMAASAMISLILLVQIFRAGKVTHVRIQGAIAVYLLFGVMWAHAYHIVEILHPGSFNFPPGELFSMGDWTYFSFITLTTVGYGDVTPVQPIARNLAVAEALAGQLFLAVMIARLVAMEIVFWQHKVENGDFENS